MENAIANLVQQFEAGQIDRRQLVAGLGALVAVLSGTRPARADEEVGSPTFEAVGLNHIALRVTDVLRSREFYKKHLGLKVTRDGGATSSTFASPKASTSQWPSECSASASASARLISPAMMSTALFGA